MYLYILYQYKTKNFPVLYKGILEMMNMVLFIMMLTSLCLYDTTATTVGVGSPHKRQRRQRNMNGNMGKVFK